MKINCQHGYFTFEESRPGDISRFMSLFAGLSIVSIGNRFTFEDLADAPEYSIAGKTYLGAIATATFTGTPGEIMRENKLIYDFDLGTLRPIASIVKKIKLSTASNYFLTPGLIMPGSLTDDGTRVTDYSAWYLFDSGKFKYSEVGRG